ncbi:hypothetical protein [Nocardioides perillae]|uniref:Uncharacterized protein n=1 Tax=Nocardioides perillae TaxID=1119534 RepID=A0A7Y9UKX3_9ACTN|nr:hypothetical protein [Nocardioides perillae]NYG55828.1 hypothetical protein [Nocardioides perillae]
MTTTPPAPQVPHQRVGAGARPAQPAQVVDIDAEVLAASRQRPLITLDHLDEHATAVLLGVLLDGRAGHPGAEARALRGEALVHHLVTRSSPADLVRHGVRVGRMVRALDPEARAEVLDELGPHGSPRRALVERLATAGDATARAYAVGFTGWSAPTA